MKKFGRPLLLMFAMITWKSAKAAIGEEMSGDFIEVRRLLEDIRVATLHRLGIYWDYERIKATKNKPATFSDGTEASVNRLLADDLFENDILLTLPQAKKILEEVKAYAWQNLIKSALRHIESQTCIRFTESDQTQDYLQYIRGSGCWSSVGRTGGRQQVSVGYGCDAMGIVAHETLHALGLWHEQSRSDRDNYITIDFDGIYAGTQSNFEKRTAATNDHLGQPYDLGSVMHYGSKAFSTDYNTYSITTKDVNYQQTLGQRVGISFKDGKMINLRYCSKVCGRSLECQAGGYTDPNNCAQCKCPDGYSGVNCQQVASSNRAACRGGELTAFAQANFITSPNVEAKISCHWRIKAPSNQRVELTVSKVNFPCRDSCASYVELKYKSDKAPTGARLCCGLPKKTIISENSEVIITFYGEDQIPAGYQGFIVAYKAVSPDARSSALTATTDLSLSTTTKSPPARSSSTPRSKNGETSEWSDWAAWSACSVSCGGCGKRRRVRACYGGDRKCSGAASEMENCGLQVCPIPEKTTRCTGRLLMPCDLLKQLDFGTVLNAGLEINNDTSKKNNSSSTIPNQPDNHLLDTPKNADILRRIRKDLLQERRKRFVIGDRQLETKTYCEKSEPKLTTPSENPLFGWTEAESLEQRAEMKKVRFSDEEDNIDGELAAFGGYNNVHSQPATTNGSAGDVTENGESIVELKTRLKEQQDHIQVLSETLKRLEEAGTQQHGRANHLHNSLTIEQTQSKIDELERENQEKETTINDLRRGLSNALEVASNSMTNGYSEKEEEYVQKIASLEADIQKLEQKLSNATEEKEYYKKHYNSSHDNHSSSNNYSNAMNGSISDRDDFGKELMLANKRKYHLESKVRQLEHDLKEAQNTVQHLDRSLQSSEKYLWLEKEKSAVLEQERKSLNDELDWLRRDNDYLKRQIEALNQEKNSGMESPSAEGQSSCPNSPKEQLFSEMERIHKDYDVKIGDVLQMKNQLEWRLGEITKNWNDAKWRVGELEAALAHKDYELEQSANRIKQLESVLATPLTNMSEEINWLKEEVRKVGEEKSNVEWKLGEVTQYWNDAKWRIGELEAEISHIKHSLEEAHRRNAELENHSELKRELEKVRQDKGHLEWRLNELNQACNDAKWRVGELECEVGRKSDHINYLETGGHAQRNFDEERNTLHRQLDELRDQKSKVEWRLGEVTQYWNNTKWRVSELEENLKQKDNQLRDASFKMEQLAESRQQSSLNISEKVLTQLSNGSFIVSKQPHGDRHRWNMVTWDNLVSQNADLRRVWFEVNAEGAKDIFLIGSFVNWECAFLCDPLPNEPSRKGVWIDLPPGTHQFRFIRDGSWFTASDYPQEHNEYGGTNNWVLVG